MEKGICKKVFISSTSFDLEDVRAELAKVLKEWGYLPIWNESPDFPKKRGLHSHDICLDAVKDCDIYVLIIDKRYGGTYAGSKYPKEDISITWYETKVAIEEGKEVFSFVREKVWNERPIYKENLSAGLKIKSFHVDDVKVFEFIDYIVHQPRDNWIDPFKTSVDLKEKLRLRLQELKKAKISLVPSLHHQTAPEPNFVGREEMLGTITGWYRNPEVRIGAVIGWGGVGKSALVRKWFDDLKKNGIRPEGIFWWGFYRNALLDRFLDSVLEYLGRGRIDLKEIKSSWQKVDRIKEFMLEGEYLIILDGLEQMQKGEEAGEQFGCMEHRECEDMLKYLVDTKGKGLCLITTRYSMTDIKNYEGSAYRKIEVERLEDQEARDLFKRVGVKGEQEKVDAVIKDYDGHALSLTLLANYLVLDFGGDIRKEREIPPFHSDEEAGGKAHRMLLWYDKQLNEAQRAFMKIFSLFRTPVTEGDFKGVFRAEMETEINKALRSMTEFSFKRMVDNLCDRRLINKGQDNTYATHPLIKNYFESIFEEEDKKLCHKRIYEYIGMYAPERPETIEEMQPLFEQVYHGCAAGLYDEVRENIYRDRICRRDEYFITHKLGAWETDLSLARTFFPDGDVSQMPLVSDKRVQGWLLNEVGLALLCTGKAKEAEEPSLTGIQIAIDAEHWKNASAGYQNLTDLQFRAGELLSGLESARNALEMAEKAKYNEYICNSKAHLGRILHLLGSSKEAGKEFRQADELEGKISAHRLYSQRGVKYARFLLSIKQIDEALTLTLVNLEICRDILRKIDDISSCHRCLGAIQRITGNYTEAGEHLREALEIARNIGMPDLEIEALSEYGRLHLDMGRLDEAVGVGERVLKLCERTGFRFYEPEAEIVLGKAYLKKKNLKKAESYAKSAYDKATGMKYRWREGDAAHLLGEVYLAMGDKKEAREWLEKAVACRKQIFDSNAQESEILLKSIET